MLSYKYIGTPLGKMLLLASAKGLQGAWFFQQKYYPQISNNWIQQDTAILTNATDYFINYFEGEEPLLNFSLDLQGTEFQKKVWDELLNIKYGQSVSYKSVAQSIDQPTATRAVSSAIGKNPVSIIVPCHRVLSSKGELTGYAGGLDKKAYLLQLEGVKLSKW